MELDDLVQQPPTGVRIGWEQSFQRMHAEGDDQLLFPDVFEYETFEEWL
jgi:antitoxin MazE